MVFSQIWYLHQQDLQDQNKGIINCAELPSNDEITRFDGTNLIRNMVKLSASWQYCV
jgi:hypothetical protein